MKRWKKVFSLYKNEEVKSITYRFILLHIVFLFIVYSIFIININNLNKEYIRYNKVIASRLITINPNVKDEIVKVYTKEVNNEEIKSSENVLNDYGYKDIVGTYKNPIINKFKKKISLGIIAFLTVITVMFYIVAIKEFSKIFSKIRKFSEAAEEIVEGSFNKILPEHKEGDFYILGSQFNIMAKRLKETLHRLNKDKIYLENIISDISHQFKTPLAALILFNGLMENDEHMELEERKDLLKSSAEQLNKMDWLSKNLLKLARLEAGAVKFVKEKSLLSVTLEKAVSPLFIMAQEKCQQIIINENKNIELNHDSEWLSIAINLTEPLNVNSVAF